MMKIITIVSVAIAAFVTLSCNAQTVASHSHGNAISANAINAFKIVAIKPEPKLVVEQRFQHPQDWNVKMVAGVPVAVSPDTAMYRSVNWVFSPEVVVSASAIEAGVEFISAVMPGVTPDLSSLEIGKGGKLGKRYYTAQFQMSYQGKTRELRQAYHVIPGVGCYVTTFTYEPGDAMAVELWELLQQPPKSEVKPQRRMKEIAPEAIPLLTEEQVENLFRKVVEEEERKSSVPSLLEDMAQRRADHLAHGLWYKPWTW